MEVVDMPLVNMIFGTYVKLFWPFQLSEPSSVFELGQSDVCTMHSVSLYLLVDPLYIAFFILSRNWMKRHVNPAATKHH